MNPQFLQIVYVGVELVLFAFGLLVLWLNYRVIKENHNPLDKTLFALIFLFIVRGLRTGLGRITFISIPSALITVKQHVSTTHIIDIVLAMLGLWFILYAYDLRELYGIPLILGYFFEAYAIYTDSEEFTTIMAVAVAALTYIVHFINVIRNRSGISLSIGLVGLILFAEYFITTLIGNGAVLNYGLRFTILAIFLFGLNGFWEDKVLFDRQKRKVIQSAWITAHIE